MPKPLLINGTTYQIPLPGEAGYDQNLHNGVLAMLAFLAQTDGSIRLDGWYQRGGIAATAGWGRFATSGSLAHRGADNTQDLRLGPDSSDRLVDLATVYGGTEVIGGRPYVQLTTTQTAPGGGPSNITFTVEANIGSIWDGTNTFNFSHPGLWLLVGAFTTQNNIAAQFRLDVTETHNYVGGATDAFSALIPATGALATATTLPMPVAWPTYVSPNESSASLKIQSGVAGTVLSGVATENHLAMVYLGL